MLPVGAERVEVERDQAGTLGLGPANAFEVVMEASDFRACAGDEAKRLCAFTHVTALNHLLSKDSKQKLSVGDSTVVFWAEKASGAPVEAAFADWFDPPKDDPDVGTKRVRALYDFKQGTPLTSDDNQRFFVLGLAPNAARVSVRLWQVATVRELGERIFRHFSDLEVVLPGNAQPPLASARGAG